MEKLNIEILPFEKGNKASKLLSRLIFCSNQLYFDSRIVLLLQYTFFNVIVKNYLKAYILVKELNVSLYDSINSFKMSAAGIIEFICAET